ncbi:TEX2 protein, partial [Crypturellus undulatus]|nr:TEX2 protein [Crypturellus undulatus]
QVSLAPRGLARKRMWNKKYPIRVLLPADGDARERSLYLFVRTGREKEEWYQQLARVCCGAQGGSHGEGRTGELQNGDRAGAGLAPQSSPGAGSSAGSTEDIPSALSARELAGHVRQKILLGYSTYMARVVPAQAGGSPAAPQVSREHPGWSGATPCAIVSIPSRSAPRSGMRRGRPRRALQVPGASLQPVGDAGGRRVAWVNALLGRIFWDFLREPYWAEQLSGKIQKKLSKIKLPYFMNELTLTELDTGTSIPSVLGASSPAVDDRGLWVDVAVAYSGALQMTLQTKMDLCKLGKEGTAHESGPAEAAAEGSDPRLCLLADSDAESSSAGSSDEEGDPTRDKLLPPGAEGPSASRRILRFVDKIAKSRCFQKATENEFIKRKIEEVSNTPLLLTVEVQELAGTLAVNVPPPPTDRVWYGFRAPPRLELRVRPKLGEREVTCLHVTEWIERRLQHEFQKVLVMPNMDDLIIPIMHSGLDP